MSCTACIKPLRQYVSQSHVSHRMLPLTLAWLLGTALAGVVHLVYNPALSTILFLALYIARRLVADNDTFRYLGGLAWESFLAYMCEWVCTIWYYLDPDWSTWSHLAGRRAFFWHFLGAQTKHQKSSKTIIKHMVFAT